MHVLLINPNTTPTITQRVHEVASQVAARVAPAARFTSATGRFGAAYVASEASYAVAGHAALDAFAAHYDGHDAVLVACFGDPGLRALQELAPVPVVGMAEAACLRACLMGDRFAIVTGGERWGTMLERFVAGLGLASRLAGVVTVAPSGADIAKDPDGSLRMLEAACLDCRQRWAADTVILAGAGLAGLAERLATPVPVLCSTAASVELTLTLAATPPRKPAAGARAPTPPVPSAGLAQGLAAWLAGERR
jgi:allantoin racemase